MIIKSKLSDEELLQYIYRAADEYSNLLNHSYLIVGKNKKSEYCWFQCFFEKKHFMHLLGIDSKTMNATEFYDRCDLYNRGEGEGISIKDCTASRNHSRTTINEKSSCCAAMLHIQDAKYMKVGLKDKISQYVDFTYGYGSEATLGFRKKGDTSFPITLIPRCIDEFVTHKYKIIFILNKNIEEENYTNVVMEVKRNLFKELQKDLPGTIRELIG